jgi:hypothetical protein
MTGGIMQLAAYGAQDIYLTGNPQITYFKVVYRRHTNFAMESIQQSFSGTAGFGNRIKATIARNGDMVSGMYLKVVLPHIQAQTANPARWTDSVGHYLFRSIDIEIGGQLIDRHYADWLEIWAQLSIPASKLGGYFELIGLDGKTGLQTPTAGAIGDKVGPGCYLDETGHRILYVPLTFWFCRNIGLALPLIALQYHEVTLSVQIEEFSKLHTNGVLTAGETIDVQLWVDYIYLDTDERRKFAQVSHEYLIEQLQSADYNYSNNLINIDLTLNHPVKELIWVARHDSHSALNQWNNYTNSIASLTQYYGRPKTNAAAPLAAETIESYRRKVSSNMVQTGILQLNGLDRFAKQEGVYFNRIQTLNHHTTAPASPGINVYSFAVKPEAHQPSGTCNFSRIDSAKLTLTLNSVKSLADDTADNSTTGVIKIFAVNYNILRVMSGMGGLAYSN